MATLYRHHPQREMAEINVTPFVDVMLVLLIIFMVTAPLLHQGLDVNLPETTTQPLQMRDEPTILTVKKDGTTYIAQKAIPLGELQGKLLAILKGLDDREIYLRADEDAPYGVVVKIMAAAREAGATRLGIVTEPE